MISIVHRQIRFLFIVLIMLLPSGCGLHSQASISPSSPLSSVTVLPSDEFNYGLTTQLQNYFKVITRSSGETKGSSAPIYLKLSNADYRSETKALSSGSNAISITYTVKTQLNILDSAQHSIGKVKSFSASQTLTQNSPIINTSANNILMFKQLNRRILSNMIHWLNSESTQQILKNPTER